MRACGYKPSEKVADTGRMWTKSIWDNIPWDQIQAGEREGWVFFDDFINMPALDELTNAVHKYAVIQSSGGTSTLKQGAESEYGEVVITVGTGANYEGWIGTGGNAGGMANFMLQSAGVPHTIAFECRVKKSPITAGGLYVGFAEEGVLAAAGLIEDGGLLEDKDFLGFFVPEADPDGMDVVYNKESGADLTELMTDADTLVDDTYVKWGLKYDYKNAASKQIKFFIDGVLQSTYVTKTLLDNATNFPGGQEMGLVFGTKIGPGTTAATATMDWWRAALLVNA